MHNELHRWTKQATHPLNLKADNLVNLQMKFCSTIGDVLKFFTPKWEGVFLILVHECLDSWIHILSRNQQFPLGFAALVNDSSHFIYQF